MPIEKSQLIICIKQILRTQKHLAIFFIKEYKLERTFFKVFFFQDGVSTYITTIIRMHVKTALYEYNF